MCDCAPEDPLNPPLVSKHCREERDRLPCSLAADATPLHGKTSKARAEKCEGRSRGKRNGKLQPARMQQDGRIRGGSGALTCSRGSSISSGEASPPPARAAPPPPSIERRSAGPPDRDGGITRHQGQKGARSFTAACESVGVPPTSSASIGAKQGGEAGSCTNTRGGSAPNTHHHLAHLRAGAVGRTCQGQRQPRVLASSHISHSRLFSRFAHHITQALVICTVAESSTLTQRRLAYRRAPCKGRLRRCERVARHVSRGPTALTS